MTTLNSDIYRVSEFVEEIKAKHIPSLDDNSLAMGMFGFMGNMFTEVIQNDIIVASEWGNEMFTTRAKFEKNILTHAILAKVKDINATPASMDILIGISEAELIANMVNNVFVIDYETPIMIEDFEFHLDYNIKVTKSISATGENIYVALYDMAILNTTSTIKNPYLRPPAKINSNGSNYIFIGCKIRQSEFTKFYTKIITDDSIENKSFEFEFENQLADFRLVISNDGQPDVLIEPIFEGMPIIDTNNKYCHYTYVDSKTLRIKFIKASYEPSLGSAITVIIKTTKGTQGNFTYKEDIVAEPVSDTITYSNILYLIKPMSDSQLGIDRKSIEDLKAITPKEMLSRGNITSTTDLENYFNMLDDKNNRLVFSKKIDNQIERVYYAYIILKDGGGNIIPSNTIKLKLNESDFNSSNLNRLILNPGNIFTLDAAKDYATKTTGLTQPQIISNENTGFLYSSPYMMVLNKSPLSISYYLNILKRKYDLTFSYINDSSALQFISGNIGWKRELLTDRNKYKLTFSITQNIIEEKNLLTFDAGGNILTSKLKCIAVIYKDGAAFKYANMNIIKYDPALVTYDFQVDLLTDDTIDIYNNINIKGLYNINSTVIADAYIDSVKCKVAIYVLAQLDVEYGRGGEIDKYVPGLAGWTLCNKYDVVDGVDFIINFTDIVSSKVEVLKDKPTDLNYYYLVSSVPMLKASYIQNESKIKYFIDYILNKKIYIDDALSILEQQFGIDFKFFNTYGPAKTFTIGYGGAPLDKVNTSLHFIMKPSTTADEDIKQIVVAEIKTYVENINELSNIHMSNLCSYIKTKFSESIIYIEFVSINAYPTSIQNIDRLESAGFQVPEFLNITSKSADYQPSIIIDLV